MLHQQRRRGDSSSERNSSDNQSHEDDFETGTLERLKTEYGIQQERAGMMGKQPQRSSKRQDSAEDQSDD